MSADNSDLDLTLPLDSPEPQSERASSVPVEEPTGERDREMSREIATAPNTQTVAASTQPFILTNRYNLLEILSSGLIKPMSGFPKYYADLLRFSPGWIPILRSAAGPTLVEAVSQDDPTSFPVAVELDIDLSLLADDEFDGPGVAVTAIDGVVPAHRISRIVFRSDEELMEVKARRFANLEIPIDRLTVEPSLFEGDDGTRVIDWLVSLPKPKSSIDPMPLDRLAGAWALIAAAVPASEDLLEFWADLIVGMDRAPKTTDEVPGWIAGGRLRTTKVDRRRKVSMNDRIFEASIELLLSTNPSMEWRPADLLDRVRVSVESRSTATEIEELAAHFDYVRRVVRNDIDLQPFKSGSGYPAMKALLMVLLRPEPKRMASWENSEYGPDLPEFLAGMALSGLLTGWSRLPVEMRAPHTEPIIADRMALLLNAGASRTVPVGRLPSGTPSTAVTVAVTGQASFTTAIDGQPILERSFDLPLGELIERVDLAEDSPSLLAIAQASGRADKCVSTVVCGKPRRGPTSSDVSVFAGLPDIRQIVDQDALRSLIADGGLPPAAVGLREIFLRDYRSLVARDT